MRRLFRMMSDQVQATAGQFPSWWANLSPDPRTWAPFTWVLAALVLVILLVLLIRPRRRAGARRPELLISHGELRVAAWAAPKVVSSLQAPASAAYELVMTVSNLSASPVQLLELAVHTNGASAATAAEVAAVLPPHGAVDVSADLREAGGDEGVLDLFVYVPDMPPKTFRVRAKLLWEPWNARYRVLPLDQRVDVARGFSERAQRRRQASAWRREGGAAAAQMASERRAPFGDEGRFEPRPEFVRPRQAAPADVSQHVSQHVSEHRAPAAETQERWQDPEGVSPRTTGGRGPAYPPEAHGDERRSAPRPVRGEPVPSVRAAGVRPEEVLPDDILPGGVADDEPPAETTWPPARPPRTEHRARVPASERELGGRAPRGPTRSRDADTDRGRDPEASTDPGPDDEDAGVAWRLGDAERTGERSGLGRAARAARGTDRDGARAATGSGRRGRSAGSERTRRWAVREDAAAETPVEVPDAGQAELVGPGEGPPEPPLPRERAREMSRETSREASGPLSSRAPRAPEGRQETGAPEQPEADSDDRPPQGSDEETREERPRPRLEFPDEF